jgi:hypothetical protein
MQPGWFYVTFSDNPENDIEQILCIGRRPGREGP